MRVCFVRGSWRTPSDSKLILKQVTAYIEHHGQFFPPVMLASQFAALEPPAADEGVIEIGIDRTRRRSSKRSSPRPGPPRRRDPVAKRRDRRDDLDLRRYLARRRGAGQHRGDGRADHVAPALPRRIARPVRPAARSGLGRSRRGGAPEINPVRSRPGQSRTCSPSCRIRRTWCCRRSRRAGSGPGAIKIPDRGCFPQRLRSLSGRDGLRPAARRLSWARLQSVLLDAGWRRASRRPAPGGTMQSGHCGSRSLRPSGAATA